MTSDNIISFLKTNYRTSIYRFLLRESRDKTIKHISDIIESISDLVSRIVNSKFFKLNPKTNLDDSFIAEKIADEVSKNISKINLIKNELKSLDTSFENLKKTYSDDTTTIQKINSLLDKKDLVLLTIENAEINKEKKYLSNNK
jgi:hypothetical protein